MPVIGRDWPGAHRYGLSVVNQALTLRWQSQNE
jgi:hypothetical protein